MLVTNDFVGGKKLIKLKKTTNRSLNKLTLTNKHVELLNFGPTMLLSTTRKRIWPISGPNIVRQIVRKYVACFKVNPRYNNYFMGNLPVEWVIQYLPSISFGNGFRPHKKLLHCNIKKIC